MSRLREFARVCLVAAVLVAHASTARGDHEETEARLKTAGVSKELSLEIHGAIERGAEYLRGVQKPNGSFARERWFRTCDYRMTVLATLALRHADTPEARRGVASARRLLFPDRGRSPDVIRNQVYQAGLALMILMTDEDPTPHTDRLGTALADALVEDADWWGYLTSLSPPGYSPPNLSTTQFGALGLWAAARAGVDIDTAVWRRHLDAMLGTQLTNGSWAYRLDVPIENRGYATGTCMGLANVLLAREALREALVRHTGFARRVDAAVRRGLKALDRDGPAHLEELGREIEAGRSKRGLNGYTYYNLYALEKACIFAGREKIGGIRWYVRGAEILLRNQREDGGWGRCVGPCTKAPPRAMRSDILGTSFALLFLLRASSTYHPVTPREIDRGTSTEPVQRPDADAPPEKKPVAGARVELSLAREILARLERLIRDPEPKVEELRAALRLVDAAYHHLIPDVDGPEDAEAFEAARSRFWSDAEKLVLTALVTERIARVGRRNLRSDVNDLAAILLRGFRPAIATALRKSVARRLVQARYEVEEHVLHHAFEALLELSPGPGLEWLATKVVTDGVTERHLRRSRAGLDAIGGMASTPASFRLRAVKRLIRIFAEKERLATPTRTASHRVKGYWRDVHPSIRLALEALSRDPVTGERLADEHVGTVTTFAKWLSRHARPGTPPWRD